MILALLFIAAMLLMLVAALLSKPRRCPLSDDGLHEFVTVTDDNPERRVLRLRCLHCWHADGDGVVIPWLPMEERSAVHRPTA